MQSLLSDNWHSVRWLLPKLRDGVRVYHRVFRNKPAVLLFDPSSHKFHRLTVEAWEVVQLFDGKLSLESIWEQSSLADPSSVNGPQSAIASVETKDAISQQELVTLVSQLYSADLLQTQITPDAAEVLERFEKQRKQKLKQIFLNPLSIKFPLIYPDPWLECQKSIATKLFSWKIFLIWIVVIFPAFILVGMNWDDLTSNLSDRILNAQNLLIAWCIYPVVKAIHEWSHAWAVKRWGGTVREAGLMFLVFTPVPYVDASDSYGFTSKWQRATVAAAGVMAELVIGAIGVYIWVLVEPGMLRAIAYNLVIIAGVSTLFVNGNPLMRYDGYFVLSECLEMPNLAQRATNYWSFLFDKYLFKSKEAKSPSQSPAESKILLIYGAIAPIYRLMISLSLAWFVASEYFIFGAIIAIAGIWSSLVLPFWKGWKHLSTSPTLFGQHKTAIQKTSIALGAVIFIVVCVPVPFYAVSEAVVWVPEEAIVRAGESGVIEKPLVGINVSVAEGDLIGKLENPKLISEFEVTEAQVDELDSQLRKQEIQEVAKSIPTRQELEAKKEKLEEAKQKITALNLIAHAKGHWMFANGEEPVGQYFKRGQIVGYVIDGPSNILRVVIPQSDVDLVRTRTKDISVKLVRQPFNTYSSKKMRPISSGQKQLVSAALGSEGGGLIPIDPSKNDPTVTLERVFDCEIALDEANSVAVFGDRAQVKFNLGWTPLANQFYIRLRQAFLTRLSV